MFDNSWNVQKKNSTAKNHKMLEKSLDVTVSRGWKGCLKVFFTL